MTSLFSYVGSTWRDYIQYVDAESRSGSASAVDAQNFLSVWHHLDEAQRRASVPEQICLLANIPFDQVVRWVVGQAFLVGMASESLCKSFNRTPALKKTFDYAMESADNFQHMKTFLQATGTLPMSGGGGGRALPAINQNFLTMPMATSNAVALAGGKSESQPTRTSGLTDMDTEIVELSRVMQASDATVHAAAEDEPDAPDDEEESEEDDDKD